MADQNFKRAQTWCIKNYDKHVWLVLRLAAGDYAFVERSLVITFATDRIACKRHSKIPLRCIGPYRLINIRPEYAEVDQVSIRDTPLTSRLIAGPKRGRTITEATWDSWANSIRYAAKRDGAWVPKKHLSRSENHWTQRRTDKESTKMCDGTPTDQEKTGYKPPLASDIVFWRHISEDCEKMNTGKSLQEERQC